MNTLVYQDKQIKILHDGKLVVIFPANNEKIIIPFFCSICEYPMKTANDATSYRESGCCYHCEFYWIKPNLLIDKSSERWQEYIKQRHVAFLPSINFG